MFIVQKMFVKIFDFRRSFKMFRKGILTLNFYEIIKRKIKFYFHDNKIMKK